MVCVGVTAYLPTFWSDLLPFRHQPDRNLLLELLGVWILNGLRKIVMITHVYILHKSFVLVCPLDD